EIMGRKLTSPCFLELFWSYWHEEGMLVQAMNAISLRFQNRSSGPRDPLAAFALDPLRPLNNLLWGYIQDEQHRLTLARRVYEYDHEYGLTLFGRAVPKIRSADPRSRFLEAFHTLLHRASIFYKEDDDTTMIADPFPILNALRDVHLRLSIRYGDWSNVFDRNQAGNWARYWRQEAQWYIHAYQAVTGVDLSADTADVRHAQQPPERFTQPAFLLQQRLIEQRRRM